MIINQDQRLINDFNLFAVTASEIEFYLPGSDSADMAAYWAWVREACAAADIPVFKIEKERGREQHEIALAPCADPAKTAADTVKLKELLRARNIPSPGGEAIRFDAKPFPDQPGSGLHIHIHLADAQGENVFYKDDARISDALKFAIGGLLAWLPDCMPVFAPSSASYARFAAGSNAPLTVSWGANNRTVAVRLPDAPHGNKRIEHRVAGADADPQRVIAVILAAIHDGLTHRRDPGAQIYGDAALPMYGLPRLPATWEEAIARMKASQVLPNYFSLKDLLP